MQQGTISRIARTVCATVLAFSCCAALAACGSSAKTSKATSSSDPTLNAADISQGVAASVNGVEIGEAAVTAYIENIRATQGLTDEATWAEWLINNGFTAETLRARIIDSFTSTELMKQAAEKEGVTVDSAQVDAQISSMKTMYGTDDAWQQALAQAGITEEFLRNSIEQSLLQQALSAKVGTTAATDDEVISYLQGIKDRIDGAKRSSHILFATDDAETAQQVLDQLNAGEIEFAAAATQYSTDTGSAAKGGDVGWDKTTSFVTEYQSALDALNVGEMSGLVQSQYGYHIILCTDMFTAPEEITSLDQVPADLLATLRSTVDSNAAQTAFATWFQQFQSSSEIKVNDMPSKASYAVDLSKYQSSSATSAASTTVATSEAVK